MVFKRWAKRKATTAKKDMSRAIAPIVKRILHKDVEKKYWYNKLEPTSVSNTVTMQELFNPTNAITDQGRIGDGAKPLDLSMRFLFSIADSFNACRVIIFQYRVPNTTPAASTLLRDTGTNCALLYGPYNQDSIQAKDIRVLYDKTFMLDAYHPYKIVDIKRDLSRLPKVQWYGGSSTAGKCSYWMALISDSGTVAHPTYQGAWKIGFTDL